MRNPQTYEAARKKRHMEREFRAQGMSQRAAIAAASSVERIAAASAELKIKLSRAKP